MMNQEMLERVSFPVEKSAVYRPSMVNGELVFNPIPNTYELRNPALPPDKQKYAIVTGDYEIVTHRDVLDVIARDLLPALVQEVIAENPIQIVGEKPFLYADGAVMNYTFITASQFEVGGVRLTACVSAMNSYNTTTKAGISIMFFDDQGTMYFPHRAKQMVYALDGFFHKRGAVDLSRLTKIARIVPTVVEETVGDWALWNTQPIENERLMLLSKLLKTRLAKHVIEKGSIGITRFKFYQIVSEYLLNKNKLAQASFNYLVEANRFVKMVRDDSLFLDPIEVLAARVKTIAPEKEEEATKVVTEPEINYTATEEVAAETPTTDPSDLANRLL